MVIYVKCYIVLLINVIYVYGNRIRSVMVSVLASNAIDRGFEPQSGHTKDYNTGICCFSAKHAVLRSKSKDWLARKQNNVSKWSDMSTRVLLFQWASTIKIQLLKKKHQKKNKKKQTNKQKTVTIYIRMNWQSKCNFMVSCLTYFLGYSVKL